MQQVYPSSFGTQTSTSSSASTTAGPNGEFSLDDLNFDPSSIIGDTSGTSDLDNVNVNQDVLLTLVGLWTYSECFLLVSAWRC